MDKESELSELALGEAFRNYAYGWLFAFVFTFATALVSNGIFAVPLYEVVNANLSVTLFIVIAFLFVFVILAVMNVISQQYWVAFQVLVFAIVYCFMPFASILAYVLYGKFDGNQLAGSSFVYDGFMRIALGSFTWIAAQVSAALHSIGGTHVSGVGTYLPPTKDMPQWISAIVMVCSLLTSWIRGRAAEE